MPISCKLTPEHLGRLCWAARINLKIFGLRVGIQVSDPALLDSLLSVIPFGWKKTSPTRTERLYSVIDYPVYGKRRPCHSILVNGRLLALAADWDEICDAFYSDLEFFVASSSWKPLFVHAGAISWRNQAIILPGASHSGKTTLVRALLEAGASYYSDEFALFDSAGNLHAFPRPLFIRHNGTARRISASQLGARQEAATKPIAWVIVTRYKQGTHWQPRTLSRAEGMLALLQNTVAARRYPALALTVLQSSVRQARVLAGARGDAAQTADLILRYVNPENWPSPATNRGVANGESDARVLVHAQA